MDRKFTFDYDRLTSEHKEAAEEIAKICEAQGNAELAQLIKKNFRIVVRPVYNFDNTDFLKYCRKANIFPAVQGIIVDSNNELDYPIVSICDDIRKIENFICVIKEDKHDY